MEARVAHERGRSRDKLAREFESPILPGRSLWQCGSPGKKSMIRNTVYLLGGNVLSWIVGLLFWLVVPRAIGPVAWGELNLGFAIGGVAFAIGSFGIPPLLIKLIARERSRGVEYVGAALGAFLVFSLLIVSAVLAFTLLAGYNPHTRLVILLVTGVLMSNAFAMPAISALQALEKMHINSVILGIRQAASNAGAILAELIFRVDVVVVTIIFLVVHTSATVLQLVVTNRDIPIRPGFKLGLARRLILSGLPFWSNGMFLTLYVWIDSVLLSVLASTREVGYYAAPTQVFSTIGFVPAIVTTVVFPALSSSFRTDVDRLRRITHMSLSILILLGLPISVGIALVGQNAVVTLFGPDFRTSGLIMVILAVTVVPTYIATLAYWVLASIDRERLWAYVMGAVAIINPLLNLVAIPYFQSRYGHGSLGAAWTLLVTDFGVGLVGLVLMAPVWMKSARPLAASAARVVLATAAMAIPVWFLRDLFLPVPVVVGVAVFVAAAFGLGVFRTAGYEEIWATFRQRLRQRFGGQRPEVNVRTA